MSRFCVGFVLGLAVLTALPAFAQDRSGVITGGAIPSQQERQREREESIQRDRVRRALNDQYNDLYERNRKWLAENGVEAQAKKLATTTPTKQVEPVQLERPVEKPQVTSPGVTPGIGSGTPPTTRATDSPAPSLPQLAQAPPAPDPFANPAQPASVAPISSEVTISGPGQAYLRVPTMLSVSGFTEAELRSASLFCEPRIGCSLRRLKDPTTGEDLLMFSANRAGSYTIIVGQNLQHADWGQHSEQLVASATKANVTAELLSKLKAVTTELSNAYPVKSGRHVVNVDDPTSIQPAPTPQPRPAPTPDPIVVVPPVPVPVKPMAVGTIFTVVIGVPESMSPEQNVALDALSQWADQEGLRGKIGFIQVSPNAVDENGRPNQRVREYIAEIPAESKGKYPYVFISQVRSGGNSLILDRFEFPADANVIIDKLTRMLESANSRTITPLQGRSPQ